ILRRLPILSRDEARTEAAHGHGARDELLPSRRRDGAGRLRVRLEVAGRRGSSIGLALASWTLEGLSPALGRQGQDGYRAARVLPPRLHRGGLLFSGVGAILGFAMGFLFRLSEIPVSG